MYYDRRAVQRQGEGVSPESRGGWSQRRGGTPLEGPETEERRWGVVPSPRVGMRCGVGSRDGDGRSMGGSRDGREDGGGSPQSREV